MLAALGLNPPPIFTMSFDRFNKPASLLLALAVFCAAGLTPSDSEAAKRRSQHGVNRIKFDKGGSGETFKERERRLQRECRGRPNAGACLGFGQ